MRVTLQRVRGVRTIALALVLTAASAGTAVAATPKVPVIHEKFKAVPCTGSPATRTTTQEDFCVEDQILTGDKQINSLDRSIFTRLDNVAEKTDFVAGFNDWFNYRSAYCYSEADPYEGGTEAPIVYGQCQVTVDTAHIKELKGFLAEVQR